MQTHNSSYSRSQINLEARSKIESNQELLVSYVFDEENGWLFGEIGRHIEDCFDFEIDYFVISALSILPLTIIRTSAEIFILNAEFPHTKSITEAIIQDVYNRLEREFPVELYDEDKNVIRLIPYQQFHDEVVTTVGLIEYETSKFYYDTAKVVYSNYIEGDFPLHLFYIMIRDIGFEFIPFAATHLKTMPQYG